MYIFSIFSHSEYLEMALAKLETEAIPKTNILAVPMDKRKSHKRMFDTIHSSDGISLLDLAMALATAFAVVGASVGFRLAWGPIVWGLIGAGIGFITGFIINLITYRLKHARRNRPAKNRADVVVIVACEGASAESVKETLWDCKALSVGEFDP